MTAGQHGDFCKMIVIPNCPHSHIVCLPFPTIQLNWLPCKSSFVSGLTLFLGIIKLERLQDVIKLRRPFQSPCNSPQCFYVLGSFYSILCFKDFVKDLIRKRFGRGKFRYPIQQVFFRFFQLSSPPFCLHIIHPDTVPDNPSDIPHK